MSVKVSMRPLEIDLDGVREALAEHVMERMDPLIPKDTETLRQSARIADGGDAVEYTADYAAYVHQMRGKPRIAGTFPEWEEHLDMEEVEEFTVNLIEAAINE